MVGTLCVLALAYRYYSAFIAAKVLSLDDARITPAHRRADGKDFVPTNRWVLFGHHFAAITGAGPLNSLQETTRVLPTGRPSSVAIPCTVTLFVGRTTA